MSALSLIMMAVSSAFVETAAAAPAPWWSEQASAYIGAFGGSGIGILGGGVGTLMGILVPRGKAKTLVLGLQGLLIGAGLLILIAAAVALISGQPYHVAFPLALGGSVLTCALSGLAPMTITIYRLVDVRKAEMPGVPVDPRAVASTLSGMNLSARASEALDSLWGARGWLRRATVVAVCLGIVIAVVGAIIGAKEISSGGIAIGIVWIVLGLPGLVAGTIMMVVGHKMRQVAAGAVQTAQKQRLAAEEFRRG